MHLPKILTDLIAAQNCFDSAAYADCFSENAVVSDEGKTHRGKAEIAHWIADANKKYRSVMQPVAYTENGASSVLTAECSGTFPGSPVVLRFHFTIGNGHIQSLKVTG